MYTSVTKMILDRECNKEYVAKTFSISFEEIQQISSDITKLIEDVTISCEEYTARLAEIDNFYTTN